jgi:hypothetical protein
MKNYLYVNEEICDINKNDINAIMNEFLHSCKLKVYGYNKLKDEYWGENNNFYFTISLKNNENKTCVKINSFNECKQRKEIKKVFNNLLEMIISLQIFNIYKNNFNTLKYDLIN